MTVSPLPPEARTALMGPEHDNLARDLLALLDKYSPIVSGPEAVAVMGKILGMVVVSSYGIISDEALSKLMVGLRMNLVSGMQVAAKEILENGR